MKLGPRMRAFLAAYEEAGNITAAAKAAGTSRAAHYMALERSEAYRKAFVAAERRFGDMIEAHARKLALKGTREPIYQGGRLAGHRRRWSTALIIALLKGSKPEKYSRSEISGPGGGPVESKLTVEFIEPTPDADDDQGAVPGETEVSI